MSGEMTSRGRWRVTLALLVSVLAPLGWAVNSHRIEYYHYDALGNVRVVTDENGQVLERHDYLPFGEECTTGACAANAALGDGQPRRFTGKERDAETGLDYFGARYYGQRVGRFTTIDPVYTWNENLHDPQRWNRYAYGRNNPLRYVDPDGRHPIAIALVLAAAFVLNNPTNTNVTQGPVNDTIIPNSVIVAGGYGLAAGGARMAAKEVLQETVENVTGLPMGGLPSRQGIYEFPDALSPGRTYVGQSGNLPKRITQHERSGKKAADTGADTTAVPGGKTAREVAEQRRINELGGTRDVAGSQTSNVRNPIGERRRAEVERQRGPLEQ